MDIKLIIGSIVFWVVNTLVAIAFFFLTIIFRITSEYRISYELKFNTTRYVSGRLFYYIITAIVSVAISSVVLWAFNRIFLKGNGNSLKRIFFRQSLFFIILSILTMVYEVYLTIPYLYTKLFPVYMLT